MITGELTALISWLDWTIVLTYLRVQSCILVMPGFAERVLPARVKIAVAMALAPILAEFARAARPDMAPIMADALLGSAAVELIIGFAIGSMIRMMAFAINIAATAIASTASLSQIIGSPNEASPHPIGNLLHLGGTALLLALGMPLLLIRLLADSLGFWPTGTLPDINGLVVDFIAVIGGSFQLAMALSAPFILGGFLFQALSGVISRVMPALPIVFIGAPAAIMLALVALTLLSPMILSLWVDAVLSQQLPVQP